MNELLVAFPTSEFIEQSDELGKEIDRVHVSVVCSWKLLRNSLSSTYIPAGETIFEPLTYLT